MTNQFADAIIDRQLAPGVSTFTSAVIPDLSSVLSGRWLDAFIASSAFDAAFKPPMNAYAFNVIRRAHGAMVEHKRARDSTLAYLKERGAVTHFADALLHWEQFLGQAWHGYALLLKAFAGKAFSEGEGSIEERLNKQYNAMKHTESRISSGQMEPGAVLPVWLDNLGVCSIDAHLTYAETGTILRQLQDWAEALTNPRVARARFERLDGKPAA